MRMRNPKDKDLTIASCDFFYTAEGFANPNPIHIEIGMGKGQFILAMALKYPHLNFIGVEKYSSVAALAIKKIAPYQLPNLKILIMDAIDLATVLDHQVSCLYLNFSDPWPKKRHAKRRLTSPLYLASYDKLFKDEKVIYQKTDNMALFQYSLASLQDYGYTIKELSYDLLAAEDSLAMSEYEEKFRHQGIKIKYLKAVKKHD